MIQTRTLSLADLESYDSKARRYGGECRFLCPVCGDGKSRDDAHRSLALNIETGTYICHRCKEKGLIKEKWTKRAFSKHKTRTAAIARVFAIENISLSSSGTEQKETADETERKKQSKLERVRAKMKAFQKAFDLSPAQDYLQIRGITAETAKAFGCGYAERWEHWEKDKTGKWQPRGADRRVVFPITDTDGNVVAIHGRAIDDVFIDSPKLTNGDKTPGVFQTPGALESDVVAICEGPVDAMALYQCGMPAVALIGTSAGDWLASALAFHKLFVATDADDPGDEGAETLIADFRSRGARAFRLRPTDCKDWAEFLEKFGAVALRDLLERTTSDAFYNYQLSPRPEPASFVVENVFTSKNESGQLALDYLFAAVEKYQRDEFLMNMPTVYAYETECALAAGIIQHSEGDLSNAGLKIIIKQFIDAHLRSNSVSLSWTGKEVPLFHLLLRINGKRIDNLTCNQIQSWIICEFWLRFYSENKIEIETVKL